jgi:hypothetical protein
VPVPPGFALPLLWVSNNMTLIVDELNEKTFKCTSFLAVVGKPRASRSAMTYEKKNLFAD